MIRMTPCSYYSHAFGYGTLALTAIMHYCQYIPLATFGHSHIIAPWSFLVITARDLCMIRNYASKTKAEPCHKSLSNFKKTRSSVLIRHFTVLWHLTFRNHSSKLPANLLKGFEQKPHLTVVLPSLGWAQSYVPAFSALICLWIGQQSSS